MENIGLCSGGNPRLSQNRCGHVWCDASNESKRNIFVFALILNRKTVLSPFSSWPKYAEIEINLEWNINKYTQRRWENFS